MSFKDKLKGFGSKVADAAKNVNISVGTSGPAATGGGASGQFPRGPGCVHCHQGGVCFACKGTGKTGNLSCVHCDGSGLCKFCGSDLIRQGLKAYVPYPSVAAAPSRPKGKGCIHCKQSGFCFSCHGSGKSGNLKCVHCNGTGACKFCS